MITQPRIVCPKCQGKRAIYLGCDDQIPCVECNSTGEKYLDSPTLTMGRAAAARTRADIAGRVLAELAAQSALRDLWLAAEQTRLTKLSVQLADALLAELERTAK